MRKPLLLIALAVLIGLLALILFLSMRRPREAVVLANPTALGTLLRTEYPTSLVTPSATDTPIPSPVPSITPWNETAPAVTPSMEPTEQSPTTTPTSTATATAIIPSMPIFGVSEYGEIPADAGARGLAKQAGVFWVRTSVDWAAIEPVDATPPQFHWEGTDASLNALTQAGLNPLVLVLNNPAWAASSPCGPVRYLDKFDRFLSALAARYPGVKYWALYNEVDNADYPAYSSGGCFGGQDIDGNGKADYADYAEMLRVAWQAVHSANPTAKLVMGALAFDGFNQPSAPSGYPGGGTGGHFNSNFPAQLFAYIQAHPLSGRQQYADIVSFNYYGLYAPWWEKQSSERGISAKAHAIRRMMEDQGVSFPLLVSETGENSLDAGDEGQSQYLVKTFVRGKSSGLIAMIWWTFKDFPSSNPEPSKWWKYGIITENSQPKPSYSCYQTLTRELGGSVFDHALNVPNAEGYVFTIGSLNKAVMWSSSDKPVDVSFEGSQVKATDKFGKAKIIADGSADDQDSSTGRIGIEVGSSPLYIQVVAP